MKSVIPKGMTVEELKSSLYEISYKSMTKYYSNYETAKLEFNKLFKRRIKAIMMYNGFKVGEIWKENKRWNYFYENSINEVPNA